MDNVVELKPVSNRHKDELVSVYGQALTLLAKVNQMVDVETERFEAIPLQLHGCQMHDDAQTRVIKFEDAMLHASDLVDLLGELAFNETDT